jgi:nucleotide-binding universal stress UspA family protein
MQPTARDTSESSTSGTFRRILVPIDLRVPARRDRRALEVAVELGRSFGGHVCAFHVVGSDENDHFLAGIGSPITRSDLLDEGSTGLRQFVRDVAPAEADAIECEARVESDYVEAIRTKAKEWEPTLLVLSAHSHPSLLRSRSEKLMKSLDVPVLLLDPPHTADP